MSLTAVAKLSALADCKLAYAFVGEVDLVVRFDEEVSVFYRRCLHRGALMSDGFVRGKNVISGLHYWDYRLDSEASEYNNEENLPKFSSWIEDDQVWVDPDEIADWAQKHPQPCNRKAYLGLDAGTVHGIDEEPNNGLIQRYAKSGLKHTGEHGVVDSMGVSRVDLPFMADMSFGVLSKAQAFHFKGGQGSKTGTGGHLSGKKVTGKIAEVRGVNVRQDANSPSRFPEWSKSSEIREFTDEIRSRTGGTPIGYKLSVRHIEKDTDAAIEVGVDYIILDGRGAGAAPIIFRDNISVPTIPDLARAHAHLDRIGHPDATLVITGGLRRLDDFIKALALGADAIAVSNSAMQAIGCIAMRDCHTNNCPVGIKMQKQSLISRLVVEKSAQRLANFFNASTELMQVMARACGYDHLSKFNLEDLTTWKKDMAELSGVAYGGIR